MSTYQLGFIGTGNMGGALAQAAAKSGAGMLLSNRTADKAVRLAAELGCAAGTNLEVAEGCKYIFLGVKPQMLQALLAELKAPLSARTDRPVLVSMAAGVTIRTIRETLGLPCPVVRIMPNLPVALGKGVVLISPDDTVTEDELTALEEALKPAGLLMRMPEDKLDAGSAVSGCGPAFVYLFLDALRPAISAGAGTCRTDHDRRGRNGACLRQAPRKAPIRGLQPRRNDDRRRPRAGTARRPRRCHGRSDRRLRTHLRAGRTLSRNNRFHIQQPRLPLKAVWAAAYLFATDPSD